MRVNMRRNAIARFIDVNSELIRPFLKYAFLQQSINDRNTAGWHRFVIKSKCLVLVIVKLVSEVNDAT